MSTIAPTGKHERGYSRSSSEGSSEDYKKMQRAVERTIQLRSNSASHVDDRRLTVSEVSSEGEMLGNPKSNRVLGIGESPKSPKSLIRKKPDGILDVIRLLLPPQKNSEKQITSLFESEISHLIRTWENEAPHMEDIVEWFNNNGVQFLGFERRFQIVSSVKNETVQQLTKSKTLSAIYAVYNEYKKTKEKQALLEILGGKSLKGLTKEISSSKFEKRIKETIGTLLRPFEKSRDCEITQDPLARKLEEWQKKWLQLKGITSEIQKRLEIIEQLNVDLGSNPDISNGRPWEYSEISQIIGSYRFNTTNSAKGSKEIYSLNEEALEIPDLTEWVKDCGEWNWSSFSCELTMAWLIFEIEKRLSPHSGLTPQEVFERVQKMKSPFGDKKNEIIAFFEKCSTLFKDLSKENRLTYLQGKISESTIPFKNFFQKFLKTPPEFFLRELAEFSNTVHSLVTSIERAYVNENYRNYFPSLPLVRVITFGPFALAQTVVNENFGTELVLGFPETTKIKTHSDSQTSFKIHIDGQTGHFSVAQTKQFFLTRNDFSEKKLSNERKFGFLPVTLVVEGNFSNFSYKASVQTGKCVFNKNTTFSEMDRISAEISEKFPKKKPKA